MLKDWPEDAAVMDERRAALLAKKKQLELQKRTRVFQRQLPLPSKLNAEYKKPGAAGSEMAKVGFDVFSTVWVDIPYLP